MGHPKVRLGEFLSVLTDYHANGSYARLRENVTLRDVPDYAVMIRTTNFEKEDFHDDLKYIDEHAYHFLAKSKVYPGDILMNKIASPGSVYRMPNLGRLVSLAMNLFLLRTDATRLDQTYAYYWLKSNESYVKNFACGAATATITKKAVRELEITLPSLRLQKRIAAILLAYDELIENCRLRIRALLTMSRSIYREWFVRFRFPGYEKQPPNASPLREIPKNWEIRRVTDFADFVRGFEPGSEAYSKEPAFNRTKFLRVGDLSKRVSDTFIPSDLAEGRTLVRSDIAITLDGSVGLVRLGLSGAYSAGIRKVVVREKSRLGWSFAYHLLCSDSIQATIQAHAKGTTIKHAGSAVPALEFVSPPPVLIRRFEETTAPILKQTMCLHDQIENLCKTRDLLLLPQLLLGTNVFEADSPESPSSDVGKPLLPAGEAQKHSDTVVVSTEESKSNEGVTQKHSGNQLELGYELSPPIDQTHRSDVLAVIRRVFGDGRPRNREDAIREVARALGYRRVGHRIQDVLHTDLITAVRRGILENAGSELRLLVRSIADYDRDFLKQQFLACVGRSWIERDDAIQNFCRWMGFRRTGQIIDETARSLIQGLLRESRIEADGPNLIRRSS